MIKLITTIFLSLAGLSLVGCGNGDSGFPTDPNGGNSAPEAQNLSIVGSINGNYLPFTTVVLTGTYYDVDGDEAGSHIFRWKRNGITISGATEYKYQLTGSDVSQSVSACVTPKAETGVLTGKEVCSTISVAGTIDLSNGPSATVTIDDSALALEGSLITSSYVYSAGTAPEGNSLFFWILLTNNMPSIQNCSSSPCNGTVPANVVGNVIEACVIPVDTNQIPGRLSCDTIIGAGVSLIGKLEYRQTLTATVDGFPSDVVYRWQVDTSNNEGPINDTTFLDVETGTLSYKIGTTDELAALSGYDDVNANGIVDDRDWDATTNSLKAAEFYIGKDVRFCAESASITTGDSSVCLEASNIHNADGSLCIDSSSCVSGGVYFDSSVGITARGIEPARTIELTSSNSLVNLVGNVYFHRPITVDEYELRDVLGFGNIPVNYNKNTQMGMDWITYQNDSPSSTPSDPLDFCLNLISGGSSNWYLPVQSDSYNADDHAGTSGGGNAAPNGIGQNLKGLSNGLVYNNQTNSVSPTYGWPIDWTFHTETTGGSNAHRIVKLSSGSSQGYVSDFSPMYTSCIRQ